MSLSLVLWTVTTVSQLMTTLLQIATVWSIYFNSTAFFFIFAILHFFSKFVQQFFKRERSWSCRLKKLTYICLLGSFSYLTTALFDYEKSWYFKILDGVDLVLYVASATYILSSFFKILQTGKKEPGVHEAIYRIRKFFTTPTFHLLFL